MALSQRDRALVSLAVVGLLAAGMGFAAYYGVFKAEEKEKKEKEVKEKVFDFDKAKVKGLSVFAKGKTSEMAREGDVWKLTSPVKSDADKVTVDALIERLSNVKMKSAIEEKPADLSKYGLAHPNIRVTAQLEGGTAVVLAVGDENEFDGSTYIQKGSDPTVIHAEGGLKWALEKEPFDLRDKRVLAFEDHEVKRIDVKAPKIAYALEKGDKWKLVSPAASPAEEATVNRVLSGLRNLRANSFVEEDAKDLAKYGLDKPRAEARLALGAGNARQTVLIGVVEGGGGGTKKTYAKRGEAGFVADVPDSVIEDLDRPLIELRDKTVLSFDREKVTAATFAFSGAAVRVEKQTAPDGGTDADAWTISAPRKAEAKKWKVSNALWTLSSLKASTFADEQPKDLAKFGLDKPARAVTLFGADGKELGYIKFGKDNGANVYAQSSAAPRVVEIEKSRIMDLPGSLADIEEPPPAPSDGGAADGTAKSG